MIEYLTQILGFSLGFLWGESFSSFDHMVKQTEWFKQLKPFQRWLVASLLDTQHHFQYGILLMLLALVLGLPDLTGTVLFWVGCGLVASDWRDYQRVLERYKKFGEEFKEASTGLP